MNKEKVVYYKYKIYGMVVASEIPLPEAYQCNENVEVDVYIKNGIMPNLVEEKKKKGYVNSIYKLEWYWFFIDIVGDFFMKNGNCIIISSIEGAREKSIRALILGPALAGIIVQRKQIALHGGAIVKNNKAYVLCGESGAGKSTLVTAFRKCGANFLADDTVVLKEDGNHIMAYPAFPQQKLCEDAAENYGYNREKLFLLDEERKKYAIPLLDEFYNQPVSLAIICVIEIDEVEEVTIREVLGHEKLKTVIKNLYSERLFEMIGMPRESFRTLLSIIQAVPVCIVKRPKGKFTPREQVELIETFLEKAHSREGKNI